jgi:pyrimidine operon attenuation protein/uracil phosphoribosyltransferase
MSETERVLLDAAGVRQAVERMVERLLQSRLPEAELCAVGVRSRGDTLARRIAAGIQARTGLAVPVGALDISLYRDDLDQRFHKAVVAGTDIPFSLDGRDVILVDDVLFAGRSARAAMDALMDFGRPRRIRLAVLVDRGHRELPIAADAVGLTVETALNQEIRVHLAESEGEDKVVLVTRAENS